MCGIFCLISHSEHETKQDLLNQFSTLEESISRRGPDSFDRKFLELEACRFLVASSVLWLQGRQITPQPFGGPASLLVYNGDVFGGNIPDELRAESGDTALFLAALEKSENIVETLEGIHGPHAFIFLNIDENVVYFGRDVYGRRSLLIGKCADTVDQMVISSVAKTSTGFDFKELPAIGIFSMDLVARRFKLYPWRHKNKNFTEKLRELETFLDQQIELCESCFAALNNTFSKPSSADLSLLEKINQLPSEPAFASLLLNQAWSANVQKLKAFLEEAVRKRISTQPGFCQNCFRKPSCNHALTGVLFSGGVDCAVLALLAHKFTDPSRPIDLINVAFDRAPGYATPDRLTGLATLEELRSLCPERQWNFVKVDVTAAELNEARTERIADLIYPLNTVLDDSLGCALWFASGAKTEEYSSPSRVLLVGMGADELFGGYTRHRAAYQKRGWRGLHDVLDEDWQNLPHRNLGRDDRVVSDHGRQLRTPYLDEDVVKFVRGLHCWEKSCPSKELPQGVGEKILLRTLAFHLGLTGAASLKKRALQFGSRIADPKENAHEVTLRL